MAVTFTEKAAHELTAHVWNRLNELNPVEYVLMKAGGIYELSAPSDLIVRADGERLSLNVDKSLHLDVSGFDSRPERELFWRLLGDGRIKKVYFTGMLTHGQSDFYVQYLDPDSHTTRAHYPDFLVQRSDGQHVIVEDKGGHQAEVPTVRAEQEFAEQMAKPSRMTYCLIPGSRANAGLHDVIRSPEVQDEYLITALPGGGV